MMTTLSTGATVAGDVAPGYEPVRAAFEAGFVRRGEHGAACAIYCRGSKVVDLWGGFHDKHGTVPWQADTLVLVYSLTKGMTALAAALAVSRGLFSYEDRVADLWPEFAVRGKQAVTVRQLLSEQAGLAALDLKLSLADLGRLDLIAPALAAQAPNWPPGWYAGNHAYSLGWLTSELIRRTDPSRRTLGRFFRDEIARPLDADFHIGLPADVARSRMARIDGFTPLGMLCSPGTLPAGMILGMLCPWTLTARALNNPKLPRGPVQLDVPEHWVVEDGGAGGIGSARALALIYHEFATGGRTLGLRSEVLDALAAPALRPGGGLRDQVLKTDIEYSLGLEKPSDGLRFGTTGAAFGTFAVGGSFAFADPQAQVGYAYVTNRLGYYKWDDPREKAVRDAFMHCRAAMPVSPAPCAALHDA